MTGLWQDAEQGLRALRQQRGLTAIALVALGGTIGLNTSLFTIFSALAFQPWPVENPEHVVQVFSTSLELIRIGHLSA